jgi:hypothetical protein
MPFDVNQTGATQPPGELAARARRKLDSRLLLTSAPSGLVRGATVIVKTGRRPSLQWAEGLLGQVITNPHGGSFTVRLVNSASGQIRSARVSAEDVSQWP